MRNSFLVFCLFLVATCTLQAQSIVGKWKTIDDSTGKAKSIVEIFEKEGRYFGKVQKLIDPSKQDPKCDNCKGDQKGKPIVGLVIIKGLERNGDEYSNGKITDPESGKEYKCSIKRDGVDKLNVRGYVGISLIGRTQTWYKVN